MSDDKRVSFDDMMLGTVLALNHIIRTLEDAGLTDRAETLRFLEFSQTSTGLPPNAFLGAMLAAMKTGKSPALSVIDGGKGDD